MATAIAAGRRDTSFSFDMVAGLTPAFWTELGLRVRLFLMVHFRDRPINACRTETVREQKEKQARARWVIVSFLGHAPTAQVNDNASVGIQTVDMLLTSITSCTQEVNDFLDLAGPTPQICTKLSGIALHNVAPARLLVIG